MDVKHQAKKNPNASSSRRAEGVPLFKTWTVPRLHIAEQRNGIQALWLTGYVDCTCLYRHQYHQMYQGMSADLSKDFYWFVPSGLITKFSFVKVLYLRKSIFRNSTGSNKDTAASDAELPHRQNTLCSWSEKERPAWIRTSMQVPKWSPLKAAHVGCGRWAPPFAARRSVRLDLFT